MAYRRTHLNSLTRPGMAFGERTLPTGSGAPSKPTQRARPASCPSTTRDRANSPPSVVWSSSRSFRTLSRFGRSASRLGGQPAATRAGKLEGGGVHIRRENGMDRHRFQVLRIRRSGGRGESAWRSTDQNRGHRALGLRSWPLLIDAPRCRYAGDLLGQFGPATGVGLGAEETGCCESHFWVIAGRG